jgi:hypothetical protein
MFEAVVLSASNVLIAKALLLAPVVFAVKERLSNCRVV